MAKSDVSGVVRAETRTAHSHTMTMALAPCVFEHVADNHVFISIVRFHPIGRMNSLVIKAVEIDRVRAVNGNFACIDIVRDRTDETEISVLVVTAERRWK